MRSIAIDQKIRVFVSSKCGETEYDAIRSTIKKSIEKTGLASVYLFEDDGASTATARNRYLRELNDSDVCIFLIDNFDDNIPEGVLKEHQEARKKNKKSLYFFCNDPDRKNTEIQEELDGPNKPMYCAFSNKKDFEKNCLTSLIDDIISIYREYCAQELLNSDTTDETGKITQTTTSSFKKKLLEGFDETISLIISTIYSKYKIDIEKTCSFDKQCKDFLKVLLGIKKISNFNPSILLIEIQNLLSEEFHQVVELRWKLINAYWSDNIEQAIIFGNDALDIAKKNQLPEWFTDDILVDMSYLYNAKNEIDNKFGDNTANQELKNKDTITHYPVIDKYEKYLYKEITSQTEKMNTRSPYSLTIGEGSIAELGKFVSNIYIYAVLNGSLVQILDTLTKIKNIAFYLCNQFEETWEFESLLLKTTAYGRNSQELININRWFSKLFGKTNSQDAKAMYDFNSTNPISYQRFASQLLVFEHFGYYLSDEDYAMVSSELLKKIQKWIGSDNPNVILSKYIFHALRGNLERIDKELVIKIILIVLDKSFQAFYDDVFEILERLSYKDIDEKNMKILIEHLKRVIHDEVLRERCFHLENVIIRICKEKSEYLSLFEDDLRKHMKNFYENDFSLEVQLNTQEQIEKFIRKYISIIKKRNETQGTDNKYTGYADNPYKTIENILRKTKFRITDDMLDGILKVCQVTLLAEKQLLGCKVDACQLVAFFGSYYASKKIYFDSFLQKIIDEERKILNGTTGILFDTTSKFSLRFNYILMKLSYEKASSKELIEILSFVDANNNNRIVDKISDLNSIISSLKNKKDLYSDETSKLLTLQFSLNLSNDPNPDVRLLAIKSLLLLLSKENQSVILPRLSSAIDFDTSFIKNVILHHSEKLKNINLEKYRFMLEKAKTDNHYIVRHYAAKLLSNKA